MLGTWLLAVLQYRSTYTTIYDESANRRVALAEKLRRLPLAFFGTRNLSDLTATIMSDNTEMEHTFSHAVPQLVASVLSIVLIAMGLFIFEWRLALALFWVVPLAAACLLLSKTWQRRNNRRIYDRKRAVTDSIQEGLENVQEIKSFRLEERFMADMGQQLDDYEKHLIRTELTTGVLVNGAQSLLKLGLAGVILLGAHLVSRGEVELFTYLVYLLVASRVYEPVNDVFNNLAALYHLDIRIDRLREIQELATQTGAKEFTPEHHDIEFRDVSFAYDADKPVLTGVSFTAREGRITALVGPSGCGKTTTALLAARFWDPGQGEVWLGGRNLRGIDPEILLRHFSVVFQDVVLFNASIMENIRIGRRGADDEEVRRVARLARCDEFIARLPAGFDTVIGENGETLSGGERQRISIARALLKDAPIVLLDEATASLDVENETRIQDALSELTRGKTVLVIAHRMRTIAHAHKVVVLDGGRVVEEGSPADLRARQGLFAKMMERQMTQGTL